MAGAGDGASGSEDEIELGDVFSCAIIAAWAEEEVRGDTNDHHPHTTPMPPVRLITYESSTFRRQFEEGLQKIPWAATPPTTVPQLRWWG